MFPRNKTRTLSFFLLIMLLFVPTACAASNAGDIKAADIYEAPENPATGNDLFTELSANAELYNQILIKFPQSSRGL
jgi:hypothetical protein